MHRERVSENVYWFQSEVYAQVTAGVVTGPQWAVVIDTLALPDETLAMREFVEHELNVPVRYVINTHYHADHTWGNCFFPGATVISHDRCRELLQERGLASLEAARRGNSTLRQVKIVLPQLTFSQGVLNLRVGKKNLSIMPTPGHSPDGIAVLAVPGGGDDREILLPDAKVHFAAGEGDVRQHDLDLAQRSILPACHLQGRNTALQQELPAEGMGDDGCTGEEAVAPGMVGVIVGVDHVPHGHAQLMLDELAHAERLIGQRERVNDNGPLRPGNYTGRDQGIHFTLEPEHVFRNTLAMHANPRLSLV